MVYCISSSKPCALLLKYKVRKVLLKIGGSQYMMYPIAIFILAGLCEIGGGYLIWLWLRDAQSPLLGMLGGILLITYGVIATFQVFPTFSRVYAAYGGVFIVMSIIWGYVFDKQMPDKYDVIGGIVCIIGVLIMLLPDRG